MRARVVATRFVARLNHLPLPVPNLGAPLQLITHCRGVERQTRRETGKSQVLAVVPYGWAGRERAGRVSNVIAMVTGSQIQVLRAAARSRRVQRGGGRLDLNGRRRFIAGGGGWSGRRGLGLFRHP